MTGGYYVRGFEHGLLNRLEKFGLVCVLGLPGVGKSSTAKYLCSGRNHVIFVPSMYHRFPEDFRASDGVEGFINYATFYFNVWDKMSVEEVAYIILKVFKGRKNERVKAKLREVVEGIKRDFEEKFGEEGRELIRLLESGTIESVRGLFDRVAKRLEKKGILDRA